MLPRLMIKCRYVLLFGTLGLCIVILVALFNFSSNDPSSMQSNGAGREILDSANNGLESNQDIGKFANQLDKQKPNGMLLHQQLLKGSVFLDTPVVIEFSKPVTSSIVQSFSPEVLEAVGRMFQDHGDDNMYYATLPAILRKKDGSILLVQRIWLRQYELAALTQRDLHWTNFWQENYLYTQVLDEDYHPLTKGSLLGIPTTTNINFGYRSDGPMDPRLISIRDDILMVFHTHSSFTKGNPQKVSGRTHLWDFQENAKIKLNVNNMPLMQTEINWCPLIKDNTLYLLYSFDPLRVLKCNHKDGDCNLVFASQNADENKFEHTKDHLRGGTPFVEFSYPYYISFAHSVMVTTNNWSVYTMHFVIISVEPQFRIVYVSAPVEFNRQFLYSVPVVRNHTIMAPFVYPVGIIKWTDDVMDVGVHLNDYNGHVIRIRGVNDIVKNAIKIDRSRGTKRGARVRRVQEEVESGVKVYSEHKLKFKNVNIG